MERNLFISLLIIINIALDQISKVVVRSKMDYGQEIEVIGQKFILKYVENTGAFLGMGSNLNDTSRWIFLLILPVLVLTYVTYYIFKNKQMDRLSLIAFCCIIGGGIANVFDRFAYGSVTDFFYINLGGIFKTGIFNIADMSVTFGLIALLIDNFLNKKKQQPLEN